jgi:hypothetical protein
MKALLLIQDELMARTGSSKKGAEGETAEEESCDDRFTVMVIALHNIAVEHEYQKQYQQSLTYYKKARDVARQALGAEHIMSKKMDAVFQQAAMKIYDVLEK